MEILILDIEFASDECVSGEFIEGNLIFNLPSSIPPETTLNISLTLLGREVIIKNPDTKVNETTFVDDTFSLSLITQEETSNYNKTFIISTPKNLPCTFTFTDNKMTAYIEYFISANLVLNNETFTIKKSINVLTSLSPLWSERYFFSDTGEVGCTCCMICCFLCCEKYLTKLEVVIAREALLGDPKIPLVVNIDNTLCTNSIKKIEFNFSRLVMFMNESNKILYSKRQHIASFEGPLEVNAKDKRRDVVLSIPLICGDKYLLKEPTVYSRYIICEYQLEAKVTYGSGCWLCCNNGPRLLIPFPVIEQKKVTEEIGPVEKKGIDLVLNAANIADPYQVMKITSKY